MSDRTTQKHLQYLCDEINKATGNRLEPWTKNESGKFTANIGTHYLDGAYGGWELAQMVNSGGGVRCITSGGHISKRALYDQMRAYLAGLNVGRGTERAQSEACAI